MLSELLAAEMGPEDGRIAWLGRSVNGLTYSSWTIVSPSNLYNGLPTSRWKSRTGYDDPSQSQHMVDLSDKILVWSSSRPDLALFEVNLLNRHCGALILTRKPGPTSIVRPFLISLASMDFSSHSQPSTRLFCPLSSLLTTSPSVCCDSFSCSRVCPDTSIHKGG
jgi:hypothetical protein